MLAWGPNADALEREALERGGRGLDTPEGAAAAVGALAEILYPENLRRGARASQVVRDAREAIERDRKAGATWAEQRRAFLTATAIIADYR